MAASTGLTRSLTNPGAGHPTTRPQTEAGQKKRQNYQSKKPTRSLTNQHLLGPPQRRGDTMTAKKLSSLLKKSLRKYEERMARLLETSAKLEEKRARLEKKRDEVLGLMNGERKHTTGGTKHTTGDTEMEPPTLITPICGNTERCVYEVPDAPAAGVDASSGACSACGQTIPTQTTDKKSCVAS